MRRVVGFDLHDDDEHVEGGRGQLHDDADVCRRSTDEPALSRHRAALRPRDHAGLPPIRVASSSTAPPKTSRASKWPRSSSGRTASRSSSRRRRHLPTSLRAASSSGMSNGCSSRGSRKAAVRVAASFSSVRRNPFRVSRWRPSSFGRRGSRSSSRRRRPSPTFQPAVSSSGYVERLFEQGITQGCRARGGGQPIFCPGGLVSRQQMASFLIRAFATP